MEHTLTLDVNGATLSFMPEGGREARVRRVGAALAALAALCAVSLLLAPHLAWADFQLGPLTIGTPDIGNMIQEAIVNGIILPMIVSAWNTLTDFITFITSGSILTAGFNDLLATDGLTPVKDTILSISNNGVKPVAATFFSLVILTELLKISQRMDQNQTLPAIKEVATLFVFCSIYMYLIRNGFSLVGDIYNLFHGGAFDVAASSKATVSQAASSDALKTALKDTTVGDALMIWLVMIIAVVAICVAYIKVMIASWGLAIQVYIMAAFAPLAFAFFGYDGTRGWAIGFLKNFLALSVTGLIYLIILYLFPSMLLVVSGLGNFNWASVASTAVAGLAGGVVLSMLRVVAVSFFLMKAIDSAGQWANAIFGG